MLNTFHAQLEQPIGENLHESDNDGALEILELAVNKIESVQKLVGSKVVEEINNNLEDQEKLKKILEKHETKLESPKKHPNDPDDWSDYDSEGCPTVPFVFSGMTGRLGNVMSTYANMIAFHWRLGYKGG